VRTVRPGTALPADLVELLGQVENVAVLTGAGVSAESGIPTFRQAQTGLWARHDPMQLASPEGFAHDPALVWNWYQWRRELVERSQPNPGHHALAEMAGHYRQFRLITQNVDGFHQQAGSEDVLELHGNIRRSICSVTRRPIDPSWLAKHAESSPPPSPHHPDGLARPDVVWFGEALDAETLDQAFAAAAACELMIVAGTAGVVYPAAGLPKIAAEHGARIIDINPELSEISRLADWHLEGTSAYWLRAVKGER
jgi:NAD-dependent deacetylase